MGLTLDFSIFYSYFFESQSKARDSNRNNVTFSRQNVFENVAKHVFSWLLIGSRKIRVKKRDRVWGQIVFDTLEHQIFEKHDHEKKRDRARHLGTVSGQCARNGTYEY